MSARVEHLSDGAEVVAPYAMAGHFSRESEEASPVVEELLIAAENCPPHPYTGGECVLVRMSNDQLMVVATERIAHTGSCAECSSTWERLGQALEGVPAEASITAGMEVSTPFGDAFLLVEATDLPDEFVEEHS